MTRVILLDALKEFTEKTLENQRLPVRSRGGEEEIFKAPAVYLMDLPTRRHDDNVVPYVLHQIINGKSSQAAGEQPIFKTTVESTFCVYNEDMAEGALGVINLIDRLRIALNEQWVIGDQFLLDVHQGLEDWIYPSDDEKRPYYYGKLVSTWILPNINVEVKLYEQEEYTYDWKQRRRN